MKLKNLLLSALLGSSLASSAMAATEYLYVAGAPAFRDKTNASIAARVAALGGGITATSGATAGPADINGATRNQWLIKDYPTSGNDLVVSTAYTGSNSGIQSVASGTITQTFVNNSQATLTNLASPLTGLTTGFVAYQPDVSFSNTFQISTGFQGTNKTFATGPSTSRTDTYATLTRSFPLAVSSYRFVASKGFPLTAANVTSQQLEALFRDGEQPLSFFTGNAADSGVYVYATGRDNGSGLRIATQVETGVGLTTPVKHFKPTVTGGTNLGNNRVGGTLQAGPPPLWAAGVISSTGLYYVQGNTGYVSFGGNNQEGQLLALTSETNPPGGYYLIASLEATDADAAANNGAVNLSYNGVPYSEDAIRNGKYPFWAYQFQYRRSTLNGVKATFANLIRDNWLSGNSIVESTLNVERFADGGVITPR